MSIYPTNQQVMGVKTFGLPLTGQIYKIECRQSGLCYYGSTIQSLDKRLSGHKHSYRLFLDKKSNSSITSFKVLEHNDYSITAVEFVDVRLLKQRERFYIENNTCVNKVIPGRTGKEWSATFRIKVIGYKAKWRDANREHMKQYDKYVRKPRMEARRQAEMRFSSLPKIADLLRPTDSATP
jgi:hypothetical protein